MSRKRIPSTSKLTRATGTVAYARKQKDDGGDARDEGPDDEKDDAKAEKTDEKPVDEKTEEISSEKKVEKTVEKTAEKTAEKTDAKTDEAEKAEKADDPKKKGQPKGFVAPADAITVIAPAEPRAEVAADPIGRSRTETVTMPIGAHGEPPAMPKPPGAPEMPTAVASARPRTEATVENPTFMPGPRDIPGGSPNDPAPAPGAVPRGDSRSLRREGDFALVYRVQTFVISRFGVVGTRGQWRVVEYPTSASASHAYAKECSHFVTEGFSDYRE